MEAPRPDDARDTYVRWLAAQGVAADGPIQEATLQGAAGWRFFFVSGGPGHKAHAGAVGDGLVVAARAPHGWRAFLGSGELDARHAQVAWLYGAWGALTPDTAVAASVLARHPDAAKHVRAPERTTDNAGQLRFVGWFFEPPARVPFRCTILAAADGTTTFARATAADLAAAP
jgi:hypothetical protein